MPIDPRTNRMRKAVSAGQPPGPPASTPASLLLHCDGTNESQSFSDSSANAFTVTAVGDAKISTAQSKFGGASAYFDGDGDYLEIAYDADLIPTGSQDLTIEWFMRPGATQNMGGLISTRLSAVYSNFEFHITAAMELQVLIQKADGSSSWSIGQYSATTIPADQWTHVAVVLHGGLLTAYFDGVPDSALADINVTSAGGWYGGGTPSIYIGKGGDAAYIGYLDDIRITNGLAVYQCSFTPPTSALPADVMAAACP